MKRYNDHRSDSPKKRRRSTSSASSSSSSSRSSSGDVDDTTHHLNPRIGDYIGDEKRYIVKKELGVGTFGKVYRCTDKKYGDSIAIKVVRNIKKYRESAEVEADILSDIYKKAKEVSQPQRVKPLDHIVKMYSRFYFQGHYCMVFQPLGTSLYQFVKDNGHRGFPLPYVIHFVYQMLSALHFLHVHMHLIHTDLKLENILLIHSSTVEVRGGSYVLPALTAIKVIDFGGATYDSDEDKTTVINTRQYRAPEVILLEDRQWSYASDMWAVGCMAMELLSGELLFPTHSNREHVVMIDRVVRSLSSHRHSLPSVFPEAWTKQRNAQSYLHRDGSVRTEELSKDERHAVHDLWFPKDIVEEILNDQTDERVRGVCPDQWRRVHEQRARIGEAVADTLRNMRETHPLTTQETFGDMISHYTRELSTNHIAHREWGERFLSLIEQLLRVSPEERISAKDALSLPMFA